MILSVVYHSQLLKALNKHSCKACHASSFTHPGILSRLGNPTLSEAGSTQIFCKSLSSHVKTLKSRCFALVRIRRPSQVQVFQLPVARRCTQCGEQWHSVSEVLIKFHVSCVAFQKLAQLIKTIIRDWGSVTFSYMTSQSTEIIFLWYGCKMSNVKF